MNYFEQRERCILNTQYDILYDHINKPMRGITANVCKISIAELRELGIDGVASQFCKNSLILTDTSFRPGRHAYHHAGAFYVQEPSAAAPAALLDIQRGDFVLDMCAAPGGKSAQMAAALYGEGVLVANEFVPARAAILKSNLQRMGFENCIITNSNTTDLANAYAGFFNKILVDVPCSGEGMFYKEPQALIQHSEGLVLSCARLGKEILENAAKMLCNGGVLVYSTCTFSSQENEMQICDFLSCHEEFELCEIKDEFGSSGEKKRCPEYDYPIHFTKRIYPCHGGEGHFMAKLLKKGNKNINFVSHATNRTDKLLSQFLEEYFPILIDRQQNKVGESIYLTPNFVLPQGKNVNIVLQGVHAGRIVKNRFAPEHALFMAFGAMCTNKENLTLSSESCAAFLRGEEIAAVTANNGYCAVMCDNLTIGFGKVSGGMIKNHYPKGLRNLK